MQNLKKFKLSLFALTFCLNFATAQNSMDYVEAWTKLRGVDWFKRFAEEQKGKDVLQDSEFERSDEGRLIYYNSNPLMLDGKPLDYNNFDFFSSGVLTVVRGKIGSKDAQNIPFYVYLRRNGKIVENKKMKFANKPLTKIEILDIFPFAKQGDLLIIKPAKSEDWRAKRILKLSGGGC